MAGRAKIKIGEHTVELRRTLATLRRIKEATGLPAGEWGQKVEKGEVDEGEAIAVTLWAMLAHEPTVSALSLDEMAALVDIDEIDSIAEAISRAWEGVAPPQQARGGKKARAQRKK